MLPKLVTIAPSHYCEKSRWALQLAQIPYTEERHTPFFHISAVKRAGGHRSTPILELHDRTLGSSDAITEWIANHPSAQWNPYGDENQQASILEMEQEFGRKLGVLTRLMSYQELLPHKATIVKCMTTAPTSEQKWFNFGYPVLAWLMRKGMNINSKSAEQAFGAVQKIFEEVEQNTEGEFLIGNRLTIADISFAALAAPILLPPEYGNPLPNIEEIPTSAREICTHFREMPAGQRVLRLYRDHRNNSN